MTNSDTDDPFDLARFIRAQDCVYETARTELADGRKHSHWMWFIFPQMRGLGASAMAHRYGIGSCEEAQAYLAHPVLGPRLVEVTGLMLRHRARRLRDILGSPDDMKFRSSMTLFAHAAGPGTVFSEALDAFCGSAPDEATLTLLNSP